MAIDKIVIQYEAQVAEFKRELEGLKKELRSVDSTATKGAKKTEQAFDKAGGGVNKLGANLKNLAGTMGLVLGAQEVIAFTKRTIDAASDLNETVSKTQQIFGTASAAVEAFAANSAKEFGMSKRVALDAASSFGTFGKAAGLTGEDLSTFSTDLVALSADLASFGNATPEEAALALGAALRGEAEPIRRFGVLLDDATLKQEALSMGIINNTKQALTPQQKVLAANAAILKQTADAQGDFARTSEGAANQQRILAANFENVMAMLGEKLLPAFEQGAQTLNEFMTAVDWDLVFGELGEIANSAMEPIKQLYSSLVDIFDAFTANMSAGEKTAGVFDAIGVAVNVVTTPMRVISKLFKHLTDNILVPLIKTGQNVIAWFNEVRESGGFVGAIFNGIASAAGAVIDKLEGVAQFIGIIDSDEEKLHKKRMQRDADIKKSNEEYAATNFKQQKQRTKDEERLMALQAKRAYLGQKLTKEEQAEYERLTAAKKESTDATNKTTGATEKAKTAIELAQEAISKLRGEAELLAYEGDWIGAKRKTEQADLLQKKLDAVKTTIEDINKNVDVVKVGIQPLPQNEGVTQGNIFELMDIPDTMGIKVNIDVDEDSVMSAEERLAIFSKQAEDLAGGLSKLGSGFGEMVSAFAAVSGENAEYVKSLAIVQVGIQTAAAIASAIAGATSAAATTGPGAPFVLAGYIASMIGTVVGAFAQVNQLLTAEVPKPGFFEGTPYLQLGGNPSGKDTIPVMAHEGEAIIPTSKNLQYPGLAKSWINGNLDSYIHNQFVRPALIDQQQKAEEDFADRLAASMALQMSSQFDDYRLHRDLKEQTAVLRNGFYHMKETRKKVRGGR